MKLHKEKVREKVQKTGSTTYTFCEISDIIYGMIVSKSML